MILLPLFEGAIPVSKIKPSFWKLTKQLLTNPLSPAQVSFEFGIISFDRFINSVLLLGREFEIYNEMFRVTG